MKSCYSQWAMAKNVWHSRHQRTTLEPETSGYPSTVIRSCELEGTNCTLWTLPSEGNDAIHGPDWFEQIDHH